MISYLVAENKVIETGDEVRDYIDQVVVDDLLQ